jgi:hypothetical protein
VCVGNTTTKCRYRRVFIHIHHTTAPLAHTLSRLEYVDDFFGRFAQRDNATHQSNPSWHPFSLPTPLRVPGGIATAKYSSPRTQTPIDRAHV